MGSLWRGDSRVGSLGRGDSRVGSLGRGDTRVTMAEEGNVSPGLPPVVLGCLHHRTRYGQTFGCSDPLAATV